MSNRVAAFIDDLFYALDGAFAYAAALLILLYVIATHGGPRA